MFSEESRSVITFRLKPDVLVFAIEYCSKELPFGVRRITDLTYNRANHIVEYLIELEELNKKRHSAGFSRWLLKVLLGIGMVPIFVVTFNGEVQVIAAPFQIERTRRQ